MKLLLLFLWPCFSFAAGQIDIMGGAFNIHATSSSVSSSVSQVGAYKLDYRMSFWQHFDLEVGYSIDASKGFGGDLAFGPDIGALYFPISTSDVTTASSENLTVQFQDHIKPYIGGSFHQRQYQSTNSTFAGFGGAFGAEFNYWKGFSARAEVREILFAGPSNSSANELDILVGLTFRLGK